MDALLAALPPMVTEENASIAAMNALGTEVAAASATAVAAAASAIAAPGTAGTSTTTETIGPGARSLTIQTGKSIVSGMWVIAAETAAPTTNWMAGQVDSYSSVSGLLNFTVPAAFAIGSGSISAWTVSLTGPPADAAALAANLAAAKSIAVGFTLLI
ncbi:hypothetical protein [Phenylobacterium sp.]|uniref:hypothetical protein n=1 Tax=Phenylobacterium sp. TaxID=1871053 RepID=UPI002726FE16|nr:hypothetical protein [Phenylobacterium sp.]MDO8800043.1 hypothetical protein [Phenylobacterium sp.]